MRAIVRTTVSAVAISAVFVACSSQQEASNVSTSTTSASAGRPWRPALEIMGPRSIYLGGFGADRERQPFAAMLSTPDGPRMVPTSRVVWTVDEPTLASVDPAGLLTLHAECSSFKVRADYTTLDGKQLHAVRTVSVTSDMIPDGGCPSERCINDGREQGSTPFGRCVVGANPVNIPV